MTVLIKLFYAASIAVLLVLLVAFGVWTFYAPPEAPQFPQLPPGYRPVPVAPSIGGTEPAPTPTPTQEQLDFEAQQRQYQADYQRYQDDTADYHLAVFLVAAVLGLVAVATGIALSSRLDAIRLGLVAGGLATVLYGVIQAGGDLAKVGAEAAFAVAAIGLVVVLLAGGRWLTRTNEQRA